MGKPILLVIPRGRNISPQLRRAADEIIDVTGRLKTRRRKTAWWPQMRRLNL